MSVENHGMVRYLAAGLVLICMVAMCLKPVHAHAFGVGAQGPDVFAVQGMLKSLGYFPGVIDGKYGPQTVRGVRWFQQKYGLPRTGAVDGKTLQSIIWAYGQLKVPVAKAPTPTPTPIPTPKPAPAPQQIKSGLSQEESLMLQLINKERVNRNLSALSADSPLSAVAEAKSRDMVNNKYFSHQSPVYGSPFEMLKRFGIQYRAAAENIACNQTVQAAHEALMKSPGHRANILNTNYTFIGIGIVNGGTCGKMFTQQFIKR